MLRAFKKNEVVTCKKEEPKAVFRFLQKKHPITTANDVKIKIKTKKKIKHKVIVLEKDSDQKKQTISPLEASEEEQKSIDEFDKVNEEMENLKK